MKQPAAMKIRIGTRESRLAIIQAEIVARLLCDKNPAVVTEIVTMKTSGDILKDKPLDSAGGKGLFTREFDAALLADNIDIAVHSLKDMPAVLPPGLAIAALCGAEDPRDALVLPLGAAEIDTAKPIGCSSKRRSVQLAALYPHATCALIRGNVPTRLAKLDAGGYGALVLAVAGLKRLGLESRASRIFTTDEMLPAAGQGILAIVIKEGEPPATSPSVKDLAALIDDPAARRRALVERAYTRTLDGGCGLPVAVFAREDADRMILTGRFSPDGAQAMIEESLSGGPPADDAEAEEMGQRLAFRLLAKAARRHNRLGRVMLVGAGPGDAGLLTTRGESELAKADVVVFDKLVGPGVLAKIPLHAQKIYAGKESGRHTLPQNDINALLVKKATEGCAVVRLKGGDPFLFGRGSEEALCLADAGIPYGIVSGVSSAIAVPAAAGIPVTHRGIASRLHIVSAHGAGAAHSLNDIDWTVLARQCAAGDTLVFLMGAARLEKICHALIEAGLPKQTPAAIVSSGATAKQRSVIASVETLSEYALRETVSPPAVVVIGDVCTLAGGLLSRADNTFQSGLPLRALRIAVTRPRGGKNRLAQMLDEAGAEVIELPTIKIVRLEGTPRLKEILTEIRQDAGRTSPVHPVTWFAFTSAHGVDAFFAKLAEYRIDARALAMCKFAAVGNATSAALEARGIFPDVTPLVFSSAALGEALAAAVPKDERVILPRSAIGGKEILDALGAAGIAYIDIPVYNTVPETGYENAALRAALINGLDCVAFTSPSAVEGFVTIFGAEAGGGAPGQHSPQLPTAALCIGEATAAPARAYGFDVTVSANETIEGMVDALVRRIKKS